MFRSRYGADESYLGPHQREIQRVADGEVGRLALELDGAQAEAVAVVAPTGRHYALLRVLPGDDDAARPDVHPLLEEPIDDSPAIIWLKHLDGRYIRVNRRFCEELHTAPERVCGKTDRELPPEDSIEGVRLKANDLPKQEPLDLEYTVPAFNGRPAFVVLRFALYDREGQPIAVCGIAAPPAQARVARSEGERLMRIERWSRLDETAIRDALLKEWDLTLADATPLAAPAGDESGADGASGQPTAILAERDAALAGLARSENELAEARQQTAALQDQLVAADREVRQLAQSVSAEQAQRAELEQLLSSARERLTQLEAERDSERARDELEEEATADARALERRELERLHSELDSASERDAALRDELRVAQEDAAAARTALGAEQQAAQALQAEVETLREQLERAAEVESLGERARDDVAAVTAELEAERLVTTQLREELRLTHEEASGVAAALDSERELARQLREDMRVAEEEARQTREFLEQERARLEEERTRAQTEQERAQAEQAAVETQAELAQIRDDLRLAHEETATALASLSAERERAEALEAELAAAHEALRTVQTTEAAESRPEEATDGASQTWDSAAQRALSAALAGVSEWRSALKEAVKTLGEKGGWDAVVAWCPEERRRSMKCVAMWPRGTADLAMFETQAWQSARDISAGEFGRAYGRPAPTCLLDLESAEDALLKGAAAHGISSSLLVPVRSGADTVAMLELFSRSTIAPDSELMLSLEAIALQLGGVSQLLNLAAAPHWTFGRA